VHEHLGLDVRLDRLVTAGVASGVAAVGERNVLGVALLRIRLGEAFAVDDRVASLIK
jgi:hypothetical protein